MSDMVCSLYTCNRGAGAPILMIHGIISDSTFFEETADYLSNRYRVITYDRRGYGKSNQEKFSDYSVRIQAEDAAKVLRDSCSEPAWVVGNSAGGVIAVELALICPEFVKGMILVEPSLGYDEREREKLREWNRELNEYVKSGRIKSALPAFARVIGKTTEKTQSVSLKELKQTYQNLNAFMYGELNEVQSYLPPIEKLRQISVPVIVAVTEGGKDSIFATSSKSGAEMIGWPVIRIPGYHNAAKELPEQFAEKMHETIVKYGGL